MANLSRFHPHSTAAPFILFRPCSTPLSILSPIPGPPTPSRSQILTPSYQRKCIFHGPCTPSSPGHHKLTSVRARSSTSGSPGLGTASCLSPRQEWQCGYFAGAYLRNRQRLEIFFDEQLWESDDHGGDGRSLQGAESTGYE